MLGKHAGLKLAYARLRDGGRNPFTVAFDEILSPTEARLDGRSVMLLGTNNYLGLTFDPSCISRSVLALETEGTGTTGSRIANGTYGGHAALEAQVASFLGRRQAMLFTTGYQANLGTLSALVNRDDNLLLDADSHASIYDGARLSGAQVTRFRHNDPEDLYRRLKLLKERQEPHPDVASLGAPSQNLIVVEGIYSMLGDIAPLREFVAVKKEMGAYLLVDEAHSLGVLGKRGRGLIEVAGVEDDVEFIVGTFSKSLGGVGGFCASDVPDFELLRLASRSYMFSASLPPSVVAGVSRALEIIEEQPGLRDRLGRNAEHLHHGLASAGFALGPTVSPIVSIRLANPEIAVRFWNMLLDQGIYVNLALPPATPSSQSLLRTSVSTAHSTEQINRAIDAMSAIGQELGVVPGVTDQLYAAAD
ncbi:aminotransferase class I/II-fold pyridoxal phosphate-dependent enzyme [Lichenicola cladoniae]|uniref:Aminotransferase class I/II-fold pyridoxal phosphate-dependent enzyme n=1 Tax=Lichenicola cladoniae TaxID=1484109 RepID=A0A6M8HUA1_9PROT|nr:aminotransferase class I/II-fold pyridoxal phosphate-dependent enzyme [Lichenicola cladoniae]NPD67570.1 aminotransferase class I/II-fold pyridoxal phosphate-dependent enzyme [Acetobacteraceae bacterium]QKE91785.1 aminotransferase class I/II-fold pyridoxal phosphate-dependent enzyme [Lichenicola cladoniae]